MTWYWYVERQNEITVDIDRVSTSALEELRRTVSSLQLSGALDITAVWLYPSESAWHQHMIVRLRKEMATIDRIAWSLILGNDRRRAARGLLRIGGPPTVPANLLISPRAWDGFDRRPDRTCECQKAHPNRAAMDACEVGRVLRPGDERGSRVPERESWRTYGQVYGAGSERAADTSDGPQEVA